MAVPNLQFFSPIQATRSRGAVVKIATSSGNITGPIQSSVETTMNFDLMKEQTVNTEAQRQTPIDIRNAKRQAQRKKQQHEQAGDMNEEGAWRPIPRLGVGEI